MKNNKANKLTIKLILLLVVCGFIGCKFTYRSHNQKMAAKIAEDFAAKAFTKKDFKAVKELLRTDVPIKEILPRVKELVDDMHPEGTYPVSIVATEYEIVPQSPFLNIYLTGIDEENKKYYYYLVLGLENSGKYKVYEIYRHKENSPYPKTGLLRKPL